MSNSAWKTKWKHNDIAFHLHQVNPLLETYLPQLQLAKGDSILVPLCGKSLDMNLLADRGYKVVGVELSHIAIQDYFKARGIKPKREKYGRFTRWSHGNIEILCGDIFDLTVNEIGHIGTVYDCAALTALAPDSRINYVRHMRETLSPQCQILLVTTESPDNSLQNSATTIDSEVTTLYGDHYSIRLLHGKNTIKQDPENPESPDLPMDEKVYLLTTDSL